MLKAMHVSVYESLFDFLWFLPCLLDNNLIIIDYLNVPNYNVYATILLISLIIFYNNNSIVNENKKILDKCFPM